MMMHDIEKNNRHCVDIIQKIKGKVTADRQIHKKRENYIKARWLKNKQYFVKYY